MISLKNLIGGALIIVGVVTAIRIGWSGAYLSALSTFMMGAVAGCAFLIGLPRSLDSLIMRYSAGLTLLLGIASVFFESNFANPHLRDGYGAVVDAANLAAQNCKPPPVGFLDLQERTVSVCGRQSNRDAGEAVGALTKTLYYSNTAGVIDSANSTFNAKPLRNCGDAFKVMNELCPVAFQSIKPEVKAALLKSASGAR